MPKQLRRPAICFGGWWGTGVTRAPKQLRRPAICFGGWWGQPANRTKQAKQNNRRLPGVRITSRPSPGTQAQQACLNKASPAQPASSARAAGEGGEGGADACLPACGTEPTTYSDCLLCPLTLLPNPRPALKMMSGTSNGAAAQGNHETQTSGNTNKLKHIHANNDHPCVRKHGKTPNNNQH